MLHKDGHEIVVEASAVPMKNDRGEWCGYRGVCRDITERKRNERELAEREQKLNDLVETTSDLVWEADDHGFFTYVSARAFDVFGYRPEEVVGKPVVTFVQPEARDAAAQAIGALIEKREPFAFWVMPMAHRDGTPMYAEVSGVPIKNSRGEFRGFRGMTRDITERKKQERELEEREQKLRDLIETTSDLFWETMPPAHLRYVSGRVFDILGFTPEELVGQPIMGLMAPQHHERASEGIQEIIAQHKPISYWQLGMLHKDGHEVFVEVSGVPVKNDKGEWDGYRGVCRDITERMLQERELEAREEAARSGGHHQRPGLGSRSIDGLHLQQPQGLLAARLHTGGGAREDGVRPDDARRAGARPAHHGPSGAIRGSFRLRRKHSPSQERQARASGNVRRPR